VPFIFLSGSIGEEMAIERVKQGATDYVLKDRMARLPSAVRRALAEAAERAERRRADDEVRRLNAELEQRVVERTQALERAIAAYADSERRLERRPRIDARDHRGEAVALERRLDQLGVVPVVLEMEDRQGLHAGSSLTTAQKPPIALTASMNSWKSTGFTTYALTPRS